MTVRRTGVEAISDPDGFIRVLAIDHRDSMRQFISIDAPHLVKRQHIVNLKCDIIRALISRVSGVMLEPEFSIPQVFEAGLIPDNVGTIAALEAQGYLDDPEHSVTKLLEGWSPQLAREAGASMVKLLLPYRPGSELASAQEQVAKQVIADSTSAGMSVVLEPLLWGVSDPIEHATLVVETARRFAPMGPGVLKIPFPGSGGAETSESVSMSRKSCRAITEICAAAEIPWAILSGGRGPAVTAAPGLNPNDPVVPHTGPFERFEHQLSIALSEGCSGFMVGRALWGEAAIASPADRGALLNHLVVGRFERLNDLVSSFR